MNNVASSSKKDAGVVDVGSTLDNSGASCSLFNGLGGDIEKSLGFSKDHERNDVAFLESQRGCVQHSSGFVSSGQSGFLYDDLVEDVSEVSVVDSWPGFPLSKKKKKISKIAVVSFSNMTSLEQNTSSEFDDKPTMYARLNRKKRFPLECDSP